MVPFRLADGRLTDGDGSDTALASVLGGMSTTERFLWAVVAVAMVLDIVLTAYRLSLGFVERNPVMRYALELFGIGALVLGKAFAVTVALAVRARWPQFAVVVPLALAIPWVLAVGINASLIHGV
jgi:hypothetical protein